MALGKKGLIDGVWDRVTQMPIYDFANNRVLTLRTTEQSKGKENSGDHVVTGHTCS